MDLATLLVIVLALVLLAGGLVLASLLGRGRTAELAGRLDQLAQSHAAAQAQVGERLQTQERALASTIAERLDALGRGVGDRLEKSSTQTQTALGQLQERLAVIDAAQKNITELSNQVVSLQDILASKQGQGAFGEMRLEDIIADVLPQKLYESQATLQNGKRVDCLLKLPHPPGPIAVDAKFPLESYRPLREAKDEAGRREAQRAFAAAMLTHVKAIKEKYIVPGETADGALLFLPSEAVYAELHANFPEVVAQSQRERVFIVSPSTLWALLSTIRAVVKDMRMREQAHLIQKEVGAMLEDAKRLDKRAENLQRHFSLLTADVGDVRTSASKLILRGERIDRVELEKPADSLPAPEPATDRAAEG